MCGAALHSLEIEGAVHVDALSGSRAIPCRRLRWVIVRQPKRTSVDGHVEHQLIGRIQARDLDFLASCGANQHVGGNSATHTP